MEIHLAGYPDGIIAAAEDNLTVATGAPVALLLPVMKAPPYPGRLMGLVLGVSLLPGGGSPRWRICLLPGGGRLTPGLAQE